MAVPVRRRQPSDTETVEALELDLLLEAVFRLHGYDFRDYARTSMRRRVANIMKQEEVGTISALQDKILHDRGCWERFLNGVSVNVSAMFRDPAFFLAFRRYAVPLLRTYPFIRIWQAGCSLGEEAYSLAILLEEEGLYDRALIYATDINEVTLRQARDAIYPAEMMQKYTQNYLHSGGQRSFSEYYTARYEFAILRPTLQRNIVFSQHNLVSDAPFNEFNVILCRNVMIYFNRTLQERTHQLFYDSLGTFGILGLGSRETLRFMPQEHLYEPLVPEEKLYPADRMKKPELVAVGTSLGGLNALTALLKALPERFPVPIVVVQHRSISPDGGGLTHLLQEQARLTVVEAEDKMLLEAGTVYIGPADYHLLIEEPGMLALSTDAPVRSARPSIDVLFQTASEAYGAGVLAVLLTGASADGAEGLALVKARGGRAVVEDPATAECRTMPAAGLAATAVDYVLPLPKIGEYLVTLVEGTRA